MDRLVYVAMSGAKEILNAQAANNANLANASTVGFRADLSAFQTQQVVGAGLPSRAYATDDSVGWDSSSGVLQTTGRPLDVAIKGPGWIAVQASDGTEAYTRAGDLHVDPSGLLMTATGNPVLGDSGPITVPPQNSITIGGDGSVSIVAQGQPATSVSAVGRIKLVNPPAGQLARGADGLFRSTSTDPVASDATVTLVPGTLESSNVNIAETMANMIELARSYEVQVKAMKAAEDNASSSSKLLQSS
ncbi:MAG TPA: flagellar basal-body rod protein FlgF [Steroidobacteraceae bacterium]|jgi:flagellar basal-body rod protein FlgF|nr:flagellar basal-body rod protein FlgF [Steroidobacteraceae bacterium]